MSQSASHSGATGTPLSEQPLFSEQWIAAPIEAVFDFLVDKDKLSLWFGQFADAPSVGEIYSVTIGDDDHVAQGEFLLIEPPDKIVFSWGWSHFEPVPPGSTTVTITLSEVNEGTTVELRHDGLPLGPEDIHAVGWKECLLRLVKAFGEPA
jgi:uncharacterized protein YndB with AHSA1/START domain